MKKKKSFIAISRCYNKRRKNLSTVSKNPFTNTRIYAKSRVIKPYPACGIITSVGSFILELALLIVEQTKSPLRIKDDMAKMNWSLAARREQADKGYEQVGLEKKYRPRKRFKKRKKSRIAKLAASRKQDRGTKRYYNWRAKVLKRDNYQCQDCKVKGRTIRLEAHHMQSWVDNPKLRFSVSNGLTLCVVCHVNLHPWMRKQEKYRDTPRKFSKPLEKQKVLLKKKKDN